MIRETLRTVLVFLSYTLCVVFGVFAVSYLVVFVRFGKTDLMDALAIMAGWLAKTLGL